jgi:hypothetical protein
MERTGFFTLPRELRDMNYDHVLDNELPLLKKPGCEVEECLPQTA